MGKKKKYRMNSYPDRIMDTKEVMDFLGISRVTLYKLIKKGLKGRKLGKNYKFLYSEVIAFMKEGEND